MENICGICFYNVRSHIISSWLCSFDNRAFSQSVIWGLACLFIFPVSLIFMFLYWELCKKAVLFQIVGVSFMLLSILFR